MATVHIDRLLETCVHLSASDLHLHVGRAPAVRVDGDLRSLEAKALEADDTATLMRAVTPKRNQQELQEQGLTRFAFSFGEKGRFRVSAFRQQGRVSLVLRLIPAQFPTFEQIGLPPIVKALCRRPRGVFLVTGPTGSGKTTTLATMLDHINRNYDRHIMTIEEPVEYVHEHVKSSITQCEVGQDVPSFADAAGLAESADADVVLAGPLRDATSINLAVQMAEAGRLVFATQETLGAAATIGRLIDLFPRDRRRALRERLAADLVAVVSLVLVPRRGGTGRVVAYEFLVMTPALADLLRRNQTHRIDAAIRTGKKYGMQLLDDHLWKLYEEGICASDACLECARHPAEFQARIAAKNGGQDPGEPGDDPLTNPFPVRPDQPPPDLSAEAEPEA